MYYPNAVLLSLLSPAVSKPRSLRPDPILTLPSALEESNRLYDAHLAERQQQTCKRCYQVKPAGAPALDTCPNPACTKPICASCKASDAAIHGRCHFCRHPLDNATLHAADWRCTDHGRLCVSPPTHPPVDMRIKSHSEHTPCMPPSALKLAPQVPDAWQRV